MSGRRWGVLGLAVGLSLASGAWLRRPPPAAVERGSVYDQARLLETVVAAIRSYYVDTIPESELYHRATQGLIDRLGDPYARLLERDAYRRFERSLAGTQGSIGVTLAAAAGGLVVRTIEPASPAADAGLAAGDTLVAIGDTLAADLGLDAATRRLAGEPGTAVALTVARGEEHLTVRPVRAALHRPAATPGLALGDGIGYVALTTFSREAAAELGAAIDALGAERARGLVLDLRGNPGGVLSEGVRVADLFLPRGTLLGTIRGNAAEHAAVYHAEQDERWPGMPLVLLVDSLTASAAEFVAAALQDQDRAAVVGTATYGKGVVQTTIPLARDIAVKLTTARWFAPSGRNIQRMPTGADTTRTDTEYRSRDGRLLPGGRGVVPDVEVPAPPLARPLDATGDVARLRVDPAVAAATMLLRAAADSTVPTVAATVSPAN